MFTAGKQHFKTYLCVLNRFRGLPRLYFQRLTLKCDNPKWPHEDWFTSIMVCVCG